MSSSNLAPPIHRLPGAARAGAAPDEPQGLLIGFVTLALWLTWTGVGIGGLVLHYSQPRMAAPEPPAVVAEHINVQLTNAPELLPAETSPPPESSPPPPAAEPAPAPPLPEPTAALAPPDAPPLAAVATPSPAIAFPVPVQAPPRLAEAPRAAPARSASAMPAPLRRLTFGVGEGAQPNPEYPDAALHAGQQGSVSVHFVVGPDGRVTSATLANGCRWPLLNQAAVTAVRSRWRFKPGPIRNYEITITFQIDQ